MEINRFIDTSDSGVKNSSKRAVSIKILKDEETRQIEERIRDVKRQEQNVKI